MKSHVSSTMQVAAHVRDARGPLRDLRVLGSDSEDKVQTHEQDGGANEYSRPHES